MGKKDKSNARVRRDAFFEVDGNIGKWRPRSKVIKNKKEQMRDIRIRKGFYEEEE